MNKKACRYFTPPSVRFFSNIDYEIELLYVDDGSSDDTLNSIRKVQKLDPDHVHYLTFSRNFGKEAAMYAGLQNVTGDYVGIMDVDLQDPPELIPKMLAEIENNNYDVVGSRRVTRAGEPKIRSFFCQNVLQTNQQNIRNRDC